MTYSVELDLSIDSEKTMTNKEVEQFLKYLINKIGVEATNIIINEK